MDSGDLDLELGHVLVDVREILPFFGFEELDILLIIVNLLYWRRYCCFEPFVHVNQIISIHCVNKSSILFKNFCLIFFNVIIKLVFINWSRNFHIFIFFLSSFFKFFFKFLFFKRMLGLLFKSLRFLLFFFLFLSLLLLFLLLFFHFFFNFLLNILWISLLKHRFSHF